MIYGKRIRVRIFKTKVFIRFARHEKISDSMLFEAIERAERGLIDADLGGNIIKQRLARKGQGRSKGYRVLIAVRLEERYIFIDGFGKNEKANIKDNELEVLKTLGSVWLNADDKSIKTSLKNGILEEITYEKEE